MATRRFCDLCGALAVGLPKEMTAAEIPSYGKSARIILATHFSIRFADFGFGGPPDLCINCIDGMLEKYLRAQGTDRRECGSTGKRRTRAEGEKSRG